MPPRRRHPPAPHRNEAARLADQLQQAGYTKRDIARIINRDASLVSQFYTRNKGAAFVPALTQVLTAIHTAGIIDITELASIAAPHTTRRTTASGTRARVRTKAVLITPTGTGTGRAGAQAIASGSARLRPLIAEAARQGLRLAFTVRLAKTGYIQPHRLTRHPPPRHPAHRPHRGTLLWVRHNGRLRGSRYRPPCRRGRRRCHHGHPPVASRNRPHPPRRPHHPSGRPYLAPSLTSRGPQRVHRQPHSRGKRCLGVILADRGRRVYAPKEGHSGGHDGSTLVPFSWLVSTTACDQPRRAAASTSASRARCKCRPMPASSLNQWPHFRGRTSQAEFHTYWDSCAGTRAERQPDQHGCPARVSLGACYRSLTEEQGTGSRSDTFEFLPICPLPSAS